LCRVSKSGTTLGCVSCIGARAPGGNDDGTTDSRCDPDDTKKLQECTQDNEWAAGRGCSGTKMCVSPIMTSCGNCDVGGQSVVCSQGRIAAAMSGASCASLGYGMPSAWAGVSDCCSEFHRGEDSSSFAYCK
jgi:hypothetical protein